MNWLFLAIGACFLWASVNVGEKYLVSGRIKNPFVYLCLAGCLNIFLLPIFFLTKIDIPNWPTLGLLFLTAIFYLGGSVFYVSALKKEEVSRINILWQLIPIFNFTFVYILFRETLTHNQTWAFIILVVGGILASIHWKTNQWRWSKALLIMFWACLLYSGYAVTFDYVSRIFDPLSGWLWVNIFIMLLAPVFLMSVKNRKDFEGLRSELKKHDWATIVGINFLDLGAILLNMLALSLGPVALVSSLTGVQVIFVFIMTIFLSLKAPKILKEELNKENLWLKIVALILVVTGTVMIYYSK